MRRAPRFLPLGSVSYGSMQAGDILPKLFWSGAARRLKMSRPDRAAFESGERDAARLPVDESAYWGTRYATDEAEETAEEILAEAFDVLGRYCPPACYFGSHPGDGADFGVWYYDDLPAVELSGAETRAERDAKLDAADRDGAGNGTVLEVSDHGNVLAVWEASYPADGPTVWRRVPDPYYR